MFAFERLHRDHFGLLGVWLAEPHVARWWNHDPSPGAVERDFGGAVDGTEPAEDRVVLLDGRPLGLIQYCSFHDYPAYVAEMAEVYAVRPTAVADERAGVDLDALIASDVGGFDVRRVLPRQPRRADEPTRATD